MVSFVIDASALFEMIVGEAPADDLRRHLYTGSGGAPLLTCDARLGKAHGHAAEVLVYPRS